MHCNLARTWNEFWIFFPPELQQIKNSLLQRSTMYWYDPGWEPDISGRNHTVLYALRLCITICVFTVETCLGLSISCDKRQKQNINTDLLMITLSVTELQRLRFVLCSLLHPSIPSFRPIFCCVSNVPRLFWICFKTLTRSVIQTHGITYRDLVTDKLPSFTQSVLVSSL